MLQKNSVIELAVTALTSEGNGVGRYEGMAVFVPDTAIGDRIECKIVKVHPSFCYGRLERLLVPSKDRIEPDCPVSRRCGGCALRHLSYGAEKEAKWQQVQDAFDRIGGFSLECQPLVSTGMVDGYRNKALYPVRERDGQVIIGFFARRSHEVVENLACRLQPPEFERIAGVVRDFLQEERIPCYDEGSCKGLVRQLYLRKAFATGEIMVCLVLNGETLPQSGRLLERLWDTRLPIRSVCLNVNRRNTNVVLGERTKVLWGKPVITDLLCGVRVNLSAQSFYQVNHDAAELLYQKARQCAALTGNEVLLDLYCGTGTIGLTMARQVRQLIGVEIVPAAIEDAKVNARENGIENARFLCDDASGAAQKLEKEGIRPDVVVVDPPRKGCDEQVLAAISRMGPRRVVMISCNPATAARDCARLRELGYALQEITPFDLFPRTTHVECVVLMSKVKE